MAYFEEKTKESQLKQKLTRLLIRKAELEVEALEREKIREDLRRQQDENRILEMQKRAKQEQSTLQYVSQDQDQDEPMPQFELSGDEGESGLTTAVVQFDVDEDEDEANVSHGSIPDPPADVSTRKVPKFITPHEQVLGVKIDPPTFDPTDWFKFIADPSTLDIMLHIISKPYLNYNECPLEPSQTDYISFVKRQDNAVFRKVFCKLTEDSYNICIKRVAEIATEHYKDYFVHNRQTKQIQTIIDVLQNTYLNNCAARVYTLSGKINWKDDRFY